MPVRRSVSGLEALDRDPRQNRFDTSGGRPQQGFHGSRLIVARRNESVDMAGVARQPFVAGGAVGRGQALEEVAFTLQ